jgi:hypothetical protein
LEFVDGKFLGIAEGSLLTSAAQALGISPVPFSEAEFDTPVYACTGTPDPWVIRTGGLTLVFEGSSADTAILTNWTYTGGDAAGFTEMVAPRGIRIGDSRESLIAAYPDYVDYGDEITVTDPYLEFVIDNETVTRFGIIECVAEVDDEG